MFRRALVLLWLVAAVCVAGLPSVAADDGPEDRVEGLLPVTLEAIPEDSGIEARVALPAGGLGLDVNFWARGTESSADTGVQTVAITAATTDLATPTEITHTAHLVDAWLLSPVPGSAFVLPDAQASAAEPVTPRAAEPAPVETQGASAAVAPPAVEVPPEALILTAAAAASVGWAFGIPAAIAEKLRHVLGFAGGVAGYTRLAKEDVLGHEVRDELYARVRDEPGVSVADLADASSAGRNTVVYHLRVLEREGLVRSERQGRLRVYYCTSGGRAARDEALEHAVLGHETTRSIHERVAMRPGLDQQELCEAVGVRPSLAHWHVKRLVDAGLMRKERDGRRVRYYAQG